jgi:3',5'-cyclic AMP phosphodiesterase CpdA
MIAGAVLPFLVIAGLLMLCRVALNLYRAWQAGQHKQQPFQFSGRFIIKPYLQLGDRPHLQDRESLEVIWHVSPEDARARQWHLQVRAHSEADWRAPVAASIARFDLPEDKPGMPESNGPVVDAGTVHATPVGPVKVETTAEGRLKVHLPAAPKSVELRAVAENLPPGEKFEYRILAGETVVFAATGQCRNSFEQPYSFAVAGDLGVPMRKKEQKIAHQISLSAPSFVVMAGDIVYQRGQVREYHAYYFPVYNSDVSNKKEGAPLLRSLLTFGVPGNHDVSMPAVSDRANLDEYSDLLGYYLLWRQPLNGPSAAVLGANCPEVLGDKKSVADFRRLAGERFPRMSMFSFDWGNSHWLMLDGNAYMDWTNRELLEWVERDLKAASASTWKFVCFHQPSFSSDNKHVNEQRMRLLAPVLERCGVDVVFSGHNHCYERSYPLRFKPDAVTPPLRSEEGAVSGTFQIDMDYDGTAAKSPNGVIYIVSGAAGAKMYEEGQPDRLQPYTVCHSQDVHSYTQCTVAGNKLVVAQISEDGVRIDGFTVQK